jgi:hypothetical protein
MARKGLAAAALWMALGGLLAAQGSGNRPASPAGAAATQIGGQYVTAPGANAPSYQGGKWIEITYGRPIKRGRDLWGSGADYGKTLLDGGVVWRAGANLTTRLNTEAPLVINGTTLPAGGYNVLIDLKPDAWTLILSNQSYQTRYDGNNTVDLYGGYNYRPEHDVVRAPMTLGTLPFSVDQLTWNFVDVTATGGKFAIMWDTVVATAPFTLGE